MTEKRLAAGDVSDAMQRLLYACAFWIVAADEELTSEEQLWLEEQFGHEKATALLQEFIALDHDAFDELFNQLPQQISSEEQKAVYPCIENWLKSLVAVDGRLDPAEQEVMTQIRQRLKLPTNPIAETVPPEEDSAETSSASSRFLTGHTEEITSVDIHSDGKRLYSGALDGTCRVWDLEENTCVRGIATDGEPITHVKHLPNSRFLLAGDRSGRLMKFDLESGEMVWEQSLRGQGGISGLSVFPDGKTIVVCSLIGTIAFCHPSDGQVFRTIGHRKVGALRCVDVGPDAQCLATGGDDRRVRIWDIKAGKELHVCEGHNGVVMAVRFGPEGRSVVSTGRDNRVKAWAVDSGRETGTYEGHSFSVYDVAVSPDGKRVVSASWDHFVRGWDLETGEAFLEHEEHDGRFTSVVFSKDGTKVYAGCSDRRVHILDAGS